MSGEVWDWAGRYRRRETNIGIDPSQISVSVETLVDDAIAWVDNEKYETDELAMRFHHRLVAFHHFRNGNGRHCRIAADHLVMALGRPVSAGASTLTSTSQTNARPTAKPASALTPAVSST